MTIKKNIRFIIIFMVLAMLGLLCFQWYWVKTAIAMRTEQFDRNVQDALNETVRKIEKQEIIFVAQQKILAEQQKKLVAITQNKKATKKTKQQYEKPEINIAISGTDANMFINITPSDMLSEKPLSITDQQIASLKDWLLQREYFIEDEAETEQILALHEEINRITNESVFDETPSLTKDYQNHEEQESQDLKIENKTDLLKDVLKEMISADRNIYERLNKMMLDTLLAKELKRRNITIPYEYGVKNGSNMVFSSFALNYNADKLAQAYKTTLFPNDLQSQNHFLYVHFPERQNFILRNMWLMFLCSVLLISSVGMVFYRSVSTILKQKKLSDITNDFINNMTHEFKTPISTISLATQVLQDNSVQKDANKISRYLHVIQDENHRLGTHVEKVLQMALLDKGEIKLDFELINIHEVIEQVLQNLTIQIEQKQGHIELELNAANPKIEADKLHLTNILYNLVDNAHKYSLEKPQIKISTKNTPTGLKISVSDKGIGMSKDESTKIFDKFYRISTGNIHDVKGFGLGLSYVKKMVEAHQATITVSSKLGEGSCFELIFI